MRTCPRELEVKVACALGRVGKLTVCEYKDIKPKACGPGAQAHKMMDQGFKT
jgi:hypothetical protein